MAAVGLRKSAGSDDASKVSNESTTGGSKNVRLLHRVAWLGG